MYKNMVTSSDNKIKPLFESKFNIYKTDLGEQFYVIKSETELTLHLLVRPSYVRL